MSRSLVRARGALAAGALQQALRDYRGHLYRYPADLEARRELRQVQRALWGLAERARGPLREELVQAVVEAVRMVRIDPHSPWQAVEYLEDLLALDPGSVEALVKLAEAASGAGANEVAVQALQDALALDPSHAPALRRLGELSALLGQAARARACMRRLARLRPQDGDVARLARAAEVSYGQARVRRHMERALGPEDGGRRLERRGLEPVGQPQVCVREREDPARVPLAWLRPPRPSDSGWIVAPRPVPPPPAARLRALPAGPPLAPLPAAWFAPPARPMPLPALPVAPLPVPARLKGFYERLLRPTPTLCGALGGLFAWIALAVLQVRIGPW